MDDEEFQEETINLLKQIKYILSEISESNRTHISNLTKRNNDLHETNLKFRRYELEVLEKGHS